MYVYAWEFSEMLRVMMLCAASASNLYSLPVLAPLIFLFHPTLIHLCGLVHISVGSHMTVQCHEFQQSFPKWPRSSIYHLYHWIADSNLTWKSLVIIASYFIFFSFLHDSCFLNSSIIKHSVGSSTFLNILVISPSRRWSLNQCISNTSRFCCNLITTNISFARVLLVYLSHAAWIPSVSSTLRCSIPSGYVNMSSWMPFLSPCMLMPTIVSIFLVVHSVGGAFDASIFLYLLSYWVW